jgi:hypothetical protein
MSTKSRFAPAIIAATAATAVGIGLAAAAPAYADHSRGGNSTQPSPSLVQQQRGGFFDRLFRRLDPDQKLYYDHFSELDRRRLARARPPPAIWNLNAQRIASKRKAAFAKRKPEPATHDSLPANDLVAKSATCRGVSDEVIPSIEIRTLPLS